jgi:hypothetical protein
MLLAETPYPDDRTAIPSGQLPSKLALGFGEKGL